MNFGPFFTVGVVLLICLVSGCASPATSQMVYRVELANTNPAFKARVLGAANTCESLGLEVRTVRRVDDSTDDIGIVFVEDKWSKTSETKKLAKYSLVKLLDEIGYSGFRIEEF